MPILFDDDSGAAPGFVLQSTHAHTVSAVLPNPILLAHTNFVSGTPRNVSTLTYGGVGMTLLTSNSFIDAGNLQVQEVWYLVTPPVGANNIIATWLGTGEVTVAGISWVGVNPSDPLGTEDTNSSNSANSISVVIGSALDEVVVDFMAVKNIAVGGAVNVGAGQTQRASLYSNEGASSNRHRVKTSDEPGAASVTMSWSGWTGLACGIIAVPLKPSGGVSQIIVAI